MKCYDYRVSSRSEWLSYLLSTEPADRSRSESSICDLYAAAGLAAPGHFFWFDSPWNDAWAVALLRAPNDVVGSPTVVHKLFSKADLGSCCSKHGTIELIRPDAERCAGSLKNFENLPTHRNNRLFLVCYRKRK